MTSSRDSRMSGTVGTGRGHSFMRRPRPVLAAELRIGRHTPALTLLAVQRRHCKAGKGPAYRPGGNEGQLSCVGVHKQQVSAKTEMRVNQHKKKAALP
jgi:hypothetical protein